MPEARSKKTFKALAGALIAAALVVAPLVTAGATAATAAPKGEFGVVEPQTPKGNNETYWETRYSAFNVECYKHGGTGSNEHGAVSADRKTVTLNEFQSGWHGTGWVVLIINAGTSNNVIDKPQADVPYASPINNGGQQADVSHWIVCKGTVPTEQPEVVTPTLTWSLPTCTAEATFSRSSNATWTSTLNDDGTTTWKAAPLAGQAFADDAQTTFVVPDLTELPDGCSLPEPKTDYSEWTDGTLVCGETTVVQTRSVTITTYAPAKDGAEPIATTTTNTEQRTRPARQDEIGTCPLIPGDIAATCVGDVPYLSYDVALPEGFTVPDATPLTIIFEGKDGQTWEAQSLPLSGELLWPGASDAEPKMWPGWALVDGEYVPTEANFAWTREGVTVHFQVNPEYETTVEYPAGTALCANPPLADEEPEPAPSPTPTVTPSSTPTPTATPAVVASGDLAVTGGGVSPVLVAAGGATLAAGIAVVAIAAYRRRRAAAE